MTKQTHASSVNNAPSSRWIHRLSTVILFCMVLYAVVGLPNFHRDVTISASTDAVSPFNRLLWLLLFALSLPLMKAKWQDILDLLKSSGLLFSLFIFFTCSSLWALDFDISLRRILFAWIQIALVATLTCTISCRVTLIYFVFYSALVAAWADLIVWGIMPGYAMTSEGLAGIQLQKNQTGLIMMYGLLAGGALFFYPQSKKKRRLIIAGCLLLFFILLASKSKTCLSIVIAVPAIMGLVFLLNRCRAATAFTVLFSGVAAFLCLCFSYLLWCTFNNANPAAPFLDMTFTSRTDLWTFMLDEIQKRPWLGAGFCSFWSINPAIQPSLKTSMWFGSEAHINEAHNGYLDLLATGGLVGFVWGLAVVGYAIFLAIQATAHTQAVTENKAIMSKPIAFFHLSFLSALLIHNFTESNLFSNNALLAVALYFTFFDLCNWNRKRNVSEEKREFLRKQENLLRTRKYHTKVT